MIQDLPIILSSNNTPIVQLAVCGALALYIDSNYKCIIKQISDNKEFPGEALSHYCQRGYGDSTAENIKAKIPNCIEIAHYQDLVMEEKRITAEIEALQLDKATLISENKWSLDDLCDIRNGI